MSLRKEANFITQFSYSNTIPVSRMPEGSPLIPFKTNHKDQTERHHSVDGKYVTYVQESKSLNGKKVSRYNRLIKSRKFFEDLDNLQEIKSLNFFLKKKGLLKEYMEEKKMNRIYDKKDELLTDVKKEKKLMTKFLMVTGLSKYVKIDLKNIQAKKDESDSDEENGNDTQKKKNNNFFVNNGTMSGAESNRRSVSGIESKKNKINSKKKKLFKVERRNMKIVEKNFDAFQVEFILQSVQNFDMFEELRDIVMKINALTNEFKEMKNDILKDQVIGSQKGSKNLVSIKEMEEKEKERKESIFNSFFSSKKKNIEDNNIISIRKKRRSCANINKIENVAGNMNKGKIINKKIQNLKKKRVLWRHRSLMCMSPSPKRNEPKNFEGISISTSFDALRNYKKNNFDYNTLKIMGGPKKRNTEISINILKKYDEKIYGKERNENLKFPKL